ncbi:hypothetical protein [Photobacterium halotolerans]|uniref:hypothetical protein n=1 Tax=Photobacterium halotolerans TaxID=265726 RepID=UPI00040707BC|nr:hypothetical protein [Photobacterium halotolerans]
MPYDRVVVGIDPGKKGALVRLTDSTQEAIVMPLKGAKDIDGFAIAQFLKQHRPDMVVVEKVAARPGQGVTSMFTFGTGYGVVQGVLDSLAIPYRLITPQMWKKAILAGTTRDKEAAIGYVANRYPDLELTPPRCRVPHDGIADAACMAEFARQLL